MFVSQEKINARNRRNKIRAKAREQGQNDESSSLYTKRDGKDSMNENALAVESSRNEELAPQSLKVARIQLFRVGTPKTHIKYNTTLPAVMIVQQLMTDRVGDKKGVKSLDKT
jgi:hypothetical protein